RTPRAGGAQLPPGPPLPARRAAARAGLDRQADPPAAAPLQDRRRRAPGLRAAERRGASLPALRSRRARRADARLPARPFLSHASRDPGVPVRAAGGLRVTAAPSRNRAIATLSSSRNAVTPQRLALGVRGDRGGRAAGPRATWRRGSHRGRPSPVPR